MIPKTAFVTGSTGLLGNNLVRLLLDEGYEVRALARSIQKAEHTFADLEPQQRNSLMFVKGDLADIPAFSNNLRGCTYLFHTAAYFREYYATGDHWKKLKAFNIDATLLLLEEAKRQAITRVVYTGSNGVFDRYPDGRPSDEDAPLRTRWDNLYLRSKYLADLAIELFSRTSDLPIVTIQPGWMFGPGDLGPTGSGRLVLDFVSGKLPGIGPGGFSVVDARDVAIGMLRAAESGAPGRKYIISGPLWTLDDIVKTLAELTDRPAPRFHLSYSFLISVAIIQEWVARLSGQDPLLSRSGVRLLQDQIRFSSVRAERELGISLRPFRQTLRDVLNYYTEEKKISNRIAA